MSYDILLADDAREYLTALDGKSTRIVTEKLEKLEDDPYRRPGSGSGDKEKLVVDGEEMYRLHVGRTHTAFYIVVDNEVRVLDIMDIDEAHSRYGFD